MAAWLPSDGLLVGVPLYAYEASHHHYYYFHCYLQQCQAGHRLVFDLMEQILLLGLLAIPLASAAVHYYYYYYC
jgi:hypothetical protein